jgi:tRNA(Phe) wybutosine-synthesizing methylase Tyw3
MALVAVVASFWAAAINLVNVALNSGFKTQLEAALGATYDAEVAVENLKRWMMQNKLMDKDTMKVFEPVFDKLAATKNYQELWGSIETEFTATFTKFMAAAQKEATTATKAMPDMTKLKDIMQEVERNVPAVWEAALKNFSADPILS